VTHDSNVVGIRRPRAARHATPLAQRIAERGASIPRGDLLQTLPPPQAPAQGPPSADVLDELRAERL